MKKEPTYPQNEDQSYRYLEQFQSIDVDGDWNAVKNRMGFQKSRRISPLWRVAAIAILLLGVGILAQHYVLNPTHSLIAMTELEQKQVTLPDGSRVHLNKFSELTYPEKFRTKKREVSIKGEGYFEVASDPAKPFLVNIADKAYVEVLGTSFNINAMEENGSVSVQVVEGKVAFYPNGKEPFRKILAKDDQAVMQDGTIVLITRKDPNFLSWKTGKLYFDQEDIVSVVERLSHHYNGEILIDSTVDRSLTFTSTIDNQELESVLEELRLVVGISYSMDESHIMIFNQD